MTDDIKLFIGDKYVDFGDGFQIPMTYQLEDRTNPTVIKTAFSKTIALPGTDNNNRIFNFFKYDRYQAYGDDIIGAYFDPSKRCPFKLYCNGDLIESGYCKLLNVKNNSGVITYNINLFGGLGDFFFNLSYDENGDKKSLASLTYGVVDNQGNELNPDTELDYVINKDTVNDAWNDLIYGRSKPKTKWDVINFAPCYNGIPDNNFDANKVLINASANGDIYHIFTTAVTEDDKTYTTVDGWTLGELKKEYDEWEMHDLRSYLQRPVVRVKNILQACFDPRNNKGEGNTGYTVDLDETFFNDKNPYWEDAWMALPLLNTESESDVTTSSSETEFEDIAVGPTAGNSGVTYLSISGDDLNTDSSYILDLEEYPFSYLNINAIFGLSTYVEGVTSPLLLDKVQQWNTFWWNWKERISGRAVMVQMLAYNADDNTLLAGSDIYCLMGMHENYENYNSQTFVGSGVGKYTPELDAAYAEVRGNFLYDSELGYHIYKSTDGFDKWMISIDKCPKANKVKIVLKVDNCWGAVGDSPNGTQEGGWDLMKDRLNNYKAERLYYADINFEERQKGSAMLTAPSSVSSGALITKSKLLSTDATPCDFLLSYSKLFGLYWFKDPYEDKIYCRTRNKYFYPYVEDISALIDYSKEITVQPNVFNHKWYTMTQDTPETYYSKKYDTDYRRTYGQQRINTGYNFDSDQQELYEDASYQNALTVRSTSNYYRNFYNSDGNMIPCFFADGFTSKLYNVDDDYDLEYPQTLVDWSRVSNYYPIPGYDCIPRPCFYDVDGNQKKGVDISNVLLFFVGGYEDIRTADGEIISYWLTDDESHMLTLNDKPCWMWSFNGDDEYMNEVAIRKYYIPKFSRYITENNTITKSFDFGDPAELYVDNYTLGNGSSIYSQYWADYLKDQYNVNTKVLTCYVLWDRKVVDDMQRRFYYFENSLWILNTIYDYDLVGYKPTKCEFIRVIDSAAYGNGQLTAIAKANTSADITMGAGAYRPAPAPSNFTANMSPQQRYDEESGIVTGITPGNCDIITFADPLTESYAVAAWDLNGDGKLDTCEAASVTDLGEVFKGTGIGTFDEISYFTGIREIPAGAFEGCTNLEHFIIPDNITAIGDGAFSGCTSLDYIQVLPTDPPTLGEGVFYDTEECPILVNCQYKDDYKTYWAEYKYRIYCQLPQFYVGPHLIEDIPYLGGVYEINIYATGVTDFGYTVASNPDNMNFTLNLVDNKWVLVVGENEDYLDKELVITFTGVDEVENIVEDTFVAKQGKYKRVESITVNVPNPIYVSGVATYTYSPADAKTNISWTSSSTAATIDSGGTITAVDNGSVTFCAVDSLSNVSGCSTSQVFHHITGLTLVIGDELKNGDVASYEATPSGLSTSISFSSSSTAVTIDNNGNISIVDCVSSPVTICVSDGISGLQDCKTFTTSEIKVTPTSGVMTLSSTDVTSAVTYSISWEPACISVDNAAFVIGSISDQDGYLGTPVKITPDDSSGFTGTIQGNFPFTSTYFAIMLYQNGLNTYVFRSPNISCSGYSGDLYAIRIDSPDVVYTSAQAVVSYRPTTATTSFEWESYDTSIATVDSNGLITAVSNGEVGIAVRDTNTGVSTYKRMTVYKNINSLVFGQSSYEINSFGDVELSYSPSQITPSITFTPSSNIVEISGISYNNGTCTATVTVTGGTGVNTITLTATDSASGLSATTELTVSREGRIEITPHTLTISETDSLISDTLTIISKNVQ